MLETHGPLLFERISDLQEVYIRGSFSKSPPKVLEIRPRASSMLAELHTLLPVG